MEIRLIFLDRSKGVCKAVAFSSTSRDTGKARTLLGQDSGPAKHGPFGDLNFRQCCRCPLRWNVASPSCEEWREHWLLGQGMPGPDELVHRIGVGTPMIWQVPEIRRNGDENMQGAGGLSCLDQ